MLGDANEGGAGGLGFEDPDGLGVHEKHVIGESAFDVGFAEGDTRGGMKVKAAAVLNNPAGGGE